MNEKDLPTSISRLLFPIYFCTVKPMWAAGTRVDTPRTVALAYNLPEEQVLIARPLLHHERKSKSSKDEKGRTHNSHHARLNLFCSVLFCMINQYQSLPSSPSYPPPAINPRSLLRLTASLYPGKKPRTMPKKTDWTISNSSLSSRDECPNSSQRSPSQVLVAPLRNMSVQTEMKIGSRKLLIPLKGSTVRWRIYGQRGSCEAACR